MTKEDNTDWLRLYIGGPRDGEVLRGTGTPPRFCDDYWEMVGTCLPGSHTMLTVLRWRETPVEVAWGMVADGYARGTKRE